MKKPAILLIVFLSVLFGLTSCRGGHQQADGTHRMKVVTTLFPLFDFASKIGKEKAEIILLLPPGVEPHDFEPKPRDLATIQQADVFVYTGNTMEPWVRTILKGIDSRNLVIVDASRGITLRPAESVEGQETHGGKNHRHAMENQDPHIWLDLSNAQTIVRNILDGFVKKDPGNADFYARNASSSIDELRRVDNEYRNGLADCKTRFFLYGGHYAFNYLAHRCNLTYISVHGVSPNSEPSPAHLVEMINKMKQYHLRYIFYEELASPRVAETIANETGASLLPLNAGHNVTKDQIQRGVTFIDIMRENLAMLRKGMECR